MLNPPENLQAIVKTYRPIEELIPAHWAEGDIIVLLFLSNQPGNPETLHWL